MPAGSMVNPPTRYASVSLSSKASQAQVLTAGVGGIELSLWLCCPRMPSSPAGICHGVGAPQRYFVL